MFIRIDRAAIAVASGLTIVAAALAAGGTPAPSQAADREQSTQLISHGMNGEMPNGPSTHAVISNDKRYARAIAYESDASNLAPRDSNGATDVFVVLRTGPIGNKGAPWKPGRTVLISRGIGGESADGPSFSATVDGSFHSRPTCVAFLSAATNLVRGDTNGHIDAFVARLHGGGVKRVSLPGGRQSTTDAKAVAVSGNCKRIAFALDDRLYVAKRGGRARRVGPAGAADPSFSTGTRSDLVFGAPRGVYLLRQGKRRARLVAPGGSNPAYNDIKRQVLAYEKVVGTRTQIAYRDLGKREKIISSRHGKMGDGASRDPVIGNAGYYVSFETDASNLGVNSLGRQGDENDHADSYLYTDVRKLTLVQSVREKAVPVPGGGFRPSMSFYANYIVFDSPSPLGQQGGDHQIYMRYLGPV